MYSVFKEYYKRLAKEGWVKAFLCGILIGFIALFASAAVVWFLGWETAWWIATLLCAGVFLLVAGGATVAFYFLKFRPSDKSVALRVDALGLKERLLTMYQLKDDDSYIAQRQREDAIAAMKATSPKLLKFAISTSLIIATALVGVAGIGMTTVSALSVEGVVQGGNEWVDELVSSEPALYEVLYEVEGEGMIEGEFFQVVEEGKDASGVLAVEEDGWTFEMWVDGETGAILGITPFRQDFAITQHTTIIAIFTETEESEDSEESQESSDQSQEADEGDGQPSSGGQGEGQQSSGSSGEGGEDASGAGGGTYDDASNMVIDGEVYYGDSTYDNAYADAMDEIVGNGSISDGEGDIISDYFDTIEK